MRKKDNNGIVVLSLFDGMSCGQITLKELGIPVKTYYACEIDKHAIKQTQSAFPETVQLGSVTDLVVEDLQYVPDLVLGGSPCQGFSFSGKQLAFDDPRSTLFFEFHRIWNEVKVLNPDAEFLLENVWMKLKFQKVINDYMGVFPVRINSSLVSAQLRDRLYWSNIRARKEGLFNEIHTDIPLPEDLELVVDDIVIPENEVLDKYYLSTTMKKWLFSHEEKMINEGNGFRLKVLGNRKATSLSTSAVKGSLSTNYYCLREVRSEGGERKRTGTNNRRDKDSEIRPDGKVGAIQTALTIEQHLLTPEDKIRRLTPLECQRLQTVPEWYKWVVSDTQIYKMLGNGWTVKVIMHILSFSKYYKAVEK